jgi:hypothetical protein
MEFMNTYSREKTMSTYLYFSLTPESLIASMLPPKEFGTYLAVGTQKRTHGQAIFFTIEGLEDTPEGSQFPLEDIAERCVPHPDGDPKHSVYLSIYRVLERLPLSVIKDLCLVTQDGRVIEIEKSEEIPQLTFGYHLYQELCPVHPRIVSTLEPRSFTRYITDVTQNIHVPKICFVDLRLGELADDPEHGKVRDLPYFALEHLRDCLIQLRANPEKHTKTVDRIHPQSFPYRTVGSGVYLGGGTELLFFPFPSEDELQSTYYEWWQSASIMGDVIDTS